MPRPICRALPVTVLSMLWALAVPLESTVAAQNPSESIRANQVGFWTDGPKRIVIVDPPSIAFEIRTADGSGVVYSGMMGNRQRWVSASDLEYARIADFSDFTNEGSWILSVPDLGTSYPFRIDRRVHGEVARSVLKTFYHARASTALTAELAGPWNRAMGHPDTNVLVHPSAATDARPAGSTISSPGGWYDAGDYNKYIVNSGISTATLLMLYEHFPVYFDALDLGIPESGNALPDLLDEVLWNLRWMMTMQDPDDGGVYHKLTTANFEGVVMPESATHPRYVVQKSSAAALNFAAVAAIGARVFDDFPETRALADSLVDAAARAWVWAHYQESDLTFVQSAMNEVFDPDINTGEYGDGDLYDEYRWASTELYITTGADSLLFMYPPIPTARPTVPGWNNVTSLGLWSLAHHRERVAGAVDIPLLKQRLLEKAEDLVRVDSLSAYGIIFGGTRSDFVWGSNAIAANQANMLIVAYQWTRDPRYLRAAISNLDYLLGRNAVGYSFVTGIGSRSPMHPHHRPSQADGVTEPIPGMLVGGANPGREDGCDYPDPAPARSWIDDWCSYASNEVAINWQASIAYLAGALEAIMSPDGLPVGTARERSPSVPPSGFDVNAWPNPSSGSTTFEVSLSSDVTVSAAVYDILGRKMSVLIDRARLHAGFHRRSVDARALAPGMYIVRVMAGGSVQSRPWVVVR